MITKQEFLELYKKLQENFSGMDNLNRMARCYEYVSDLPKKAVEEIIYSAIDNERFSPIPKYFCEAAKDWKNKFYRENGYYYGTDKADRSRETQEIISNDHLNNLLKDNKVKSLLELVIKQRDEKHDK